MTLFSFEKPVVARSTFHSLPQQLDIPRSGLTATFDIIPLSSYLPPPLDMQDFGSRSPRFVRKREDGVMMKARKSTPRRGGQRGKERGSQPEAKAKSR